MKKSSPSPSPNHSPKKRGAGTFNRVQLIILRPSLFLLSLFVFSLISSAQAAGGKEGDKTLGETHYNPEPQYKADFDYSSQYVPMGDGVKLAVDVFLPKKLEEGKKVPTVVYFVRYVRTFQLKAFWRGLKKIAFGSVSEEEVKFFRQHLKLNYCYSVN